MSLLLFPFAGFGAATRTTVPVTNTALFFSPYNSYSDGSGSLQSNNVLDDATYVIWNSTGSKLRFKVTVSGGAGIVKLNLDTTRLSGITASRCPTLYSQVVGVNTTYDSTLTAYSASPVQVTLATGLADGTYEFEVIYKSRGPEGNPWTVPAQSVVITGIEIDSSASMASVTPYSDNGIFFGDSLTEGDDVTGSDIENASNDATQAAAPAVAEAFQFNLGQIGFGGLGYEKGLGNVAASADNPSFYNATDANQSWNKYWKGKSRLVSGAFSPVPDYIFILLGGNDAGALSASSVTNVLDAIRTAAGSLCWIFVFNTVDVQRSTIQTGVAAVADPSRTKYIEPAVLYTAGTPSIYSNDSAQPSLHANVRGNALNAANIIKLAQDEIAAASGGGGGTGTAIAVFGG